MSINLHCESCKKKIKAPDNAGGKYGNCPYCKHKCYIPLPVNEDEPELKLIPLDEEEARQQEDLINQTKALAQKLITDDIPVDDAPADTASSRTAEEKEVIKKCILYLRQMADGELDGAQRTLGVLKKNKKNAARVLSAMARAERPEPELADVSEGVLQGLIRDASNKLG